METSHIIYDVLSKGNAFGVKKKKKLDSNSSPGMTTANKLL